ncbi:MAG: PDZ domain-containing protein [Phycisphaerales bacterium]|nr:PDZ domain-containing protein [Phycisphaerales bacterium]
MPTRHLRPLVLLVLSALGALAPAQPAPAGPPTWADAVHWRALGPANMSGRITDFAVYEPDPTTWYVATAGGGLLKTTNDGLTFEHQFEHQGASSIGAVAVAATDPNIVWVGTGENNPRNSVSWGDGVYKSTDGGKTWEHKGLEKSFQVGDVLIHPTDPNTVFVGTLGRLWGPSLDRGLYKTTDGGEHWEKILFVDDKTGVIDLAMDPENPDVILCAMWERGRDEFDTNDPATRYGEGSGLYRTTDGGATWNRIAAGLPTVKLGRLGIDWSRSEPHTVYMLVDSEKIGEGIPNAGYAGLTGVDADAGARIRTVVDDGPAAKAGLKPDDIVVEVGGVNIANYDDLLSEIRVHQAGTTAPFTVARAGEIVQLDVTFAESPNPDQKPFTQDLDGQRADIMDQQGDEGFQSGGLFKSTDAGETWTRINSVNPRPMYFSLLRIDPQDAKHIWVGGVVMQKSEDGGKTFKRHEESIVHADQHAMWIDPRDGRHVILGCDGGIYVSRDRGEHWDHRNNVDIGQFYHVAIDNRPLYNVYGGLQDNGSWGGPNRTRSDRGPDNTDWFRIGGGDGFVCAVDPEDPDQLYAESQNGGMIRYNLRTGEQSGIRARAPRGVEYRFSWKTPFALSHFNSRVYYTAGNFLFRSLNRGESLIRISPEITRTGRGTATALSESPLDEGVIYVGSDDGSLWVTRNGGAEWSNIIYPREPDKEPAKPEQPEAGAEESPTPATADSAAGAATPDAGAPTAEPQPADTQADQSPSPAAEGEEAPASTDQPTPATQPGAPEGEPTADAAQPDAVQTDANTPTAPPASQDATQAQPPTAAAGQPEARPARGGRGGAGFFQRLDANGDGKLAGDEIPERLRPALAAADKDGDGALTEAEFAAAMPQRGRPGGPAGGPPAEAGQGINPAGDRPPGQPGQSGPAAAGRRGGAGAPGGRAGGRSGGATDRPFRIVPLGGEPEPARESGARPDDPIAGEWALKTQSPRGEGEMTLFIKRLEGDALEAFVSSQFMDQSTKDVKFNAEAGTLGFAFSTDFGNSTGTATVTGETINGSMSFGDGRFTFEFTGERAKDQQAAKPEEPNLHDLLPGPGRISSLEASRYEAGRVYMTIDRHYNDDERPYVLISDDYGMTWRTIVEGLPPGETAKVIREDIANPGMLYLGTEFGLWVSFDTGASWSRLNGNLPTVAVLEIAQHATNGEIVLATHGRSLWATDISPLRGVTARARSAPAYLLPVNDVIRWRSLPERGDAGGNGWYTGENPESEVEICWLVEGRPRDFSLTISDIEGHVVRSFDEIEPHEGVNAVRWDLRRTPAGNAPQGRFRRGQGVPAGSYRVDLEVDGLRTSRTFKIEADPDYPEADSRFGEDETPILDPEAWERGETQPDEAGAPGVEERPEF